MPAGNRWLSEERAIPPGARTPSVQPPAGCKRFPNSQRSPTPWNNGVNALASCQDADHLTLNPVVSRRALDHRLPAPTPPVFPSMSVHDRIQSCLVCWTMTDYLGSQGFLLCPMVSIGLCRLPPAGNFSRARGPFRKSNHQITEGMSRLHVGTAGY